MRDCKAAPVGYPTDGELDRTVSERDSMTLSDLKRPGGGFYAPGPGAGALSLASAACFIVTSRRCIGMDDQSGQTLSRWSSMPSVGVDGPT